MNDARNLIRRLKLRPHPEGGHFREIYRADEKIPGSALPRRYHGPRAWASSIYFMLKDGDISCLHRLRSDEVWHYYEGTPLLLHMLAPDGKYRVIRMGPNPGRKEVRQAIITRGTWFGANLAGNQGYALLGCSVAPGFDFADFELADRGKLCRQFPQHRTLITRLTYPPAITS